MASSNKKVTLDVAIQTQEEKLDKLDKELEDIKRKSTELSNKKIQMRIEADTNKLKDVDAQIKSVESELKQLKGKAEVDDSAVKSLQGKLDSLKNERINIQADIDQSQLQIDRNNIQMQVAVEKSQLEHAKAEADAMDGQQINMSLSLAMENFTQGISTCKQGVSELYDNIKQVEQAGIQSEQNLSFLSMNLGAEKARDTFKEISDIVASMPGDDNTMRSVLSTAQALGNNLNPQEMRDAAATMADYMAGSATMGKMAVESQQDIMKYLLDGNTAELERGSIVSAYVDKLKDANTFQERQKAMQEVLNQLGYGGISQMDTMLNKQAEWEGMMYNSKDALSSMWLGAEKGAMDYILKLNDASNGLVGMGIVAAQMVGGPLVEIMTGLGQIGTGFRALKDAADFTGITDKLSGLKDKLTGIKDAIRNVDLSGKFSTLKTGLTNIATSAKTAAISLGSTLKGALLGVGSAMKSAALAAVNLGRSVLTAGYNALKTVYMWMAEKAQIIASTIAKGAAAVASYALAIAEWLVASPILLVVVAVVALIAVLWYLYNTNESVRAAIDGFIAALMGLGQAIYGYLVGAFEWLQGAWQNTVDFFVGAGTAISEAITGTFTWIYESIVGIFTGIYEWLVSIWQGIIDFFTGGGQSLWEIITGVFTGIYDTIVGILGGAFAWLQGVWDMVVNAFMTYAPLIAQVLFIMATGGIGAIVLLIANMNGMPNQIGAILQSIISRVVSWVSNLVSQFTSGAQRAVSGFLSPLTGLVESVSAELSAVYSAVMGFIQPLIDAFNALGSAAAWAFSVLGMGQGSPGDIYKAVKNELEWTTRFVEDDKTGLVSATGELGASVTGSFNPTFTPTVQSNGGLSDNNVIIGLLNELVTAVKNNQGNRGGLVFNHYGDVDTEERMQRILDYIIRVTDWDNDTAGRNMEVL